MNVKALCSRKGQKVWCKSQKSVIRKKRFHIKSKSEKAGEKQLFLPELLQMYMTANLKLIIKKNRDAAAARHLYDVDFSGEPVINNGKSTKK